MKMKAARFVAIPKIHLSPDTGFCECQDARTIGLSRECGDCDANAYMYLCRKNIDGLVEMFKGAFRMK